ncbi:MAG: RpiB/LacA/LacB family sugar-phosphate isomerase [Candidatus Kerfeldbacteria bacterium]|nr:RpiB/LacA/LacB family sugar-phosphate isomerase [Candidatus Kerfeldbacteria bacterium]
MLYLGSDHAGYALKEAVRRYLDEQGIRYTDLGTHSAESVDFCDYAFPVAESVVREREQGHDALGILFCGSGIGMDIAANKVRGARAALAMTPYMGAQSREHDNANILVLAGRILSEEQSIEILTAFLSAEFDGQENHARRMQKISDYESTHFTV